MPSSDSKILMIYSTVHFFIHCPGNVFAALIILIMANFGLDYVQFSLIASEVGFASSFSFPVAGALADRFGRRIFPSLSAVITGSTALIIGLFGGRSIFLFTGGLLVMAFSMAMFHPSSMTMISNRFQRRRSGAFSIFQSGGQVGVGTGQLTVAILLWLGRDSDPFLAYRLWSVPILLMSVIMITLHLQDPTIGVNTEREHHPSSKIVESSNSAPSSIKMLFIPAFLLLLLVLSLDSFGFSLYRLYIIPFLVEERHVLEVTAIFYFSMLKLLGFPGTLIGGFAGDVYGEKRVLIGAYALVTLGLILLLLLQNSIFLPLIFLILAFGLNATMPTMDSLTAKIVPLRARGKAYGLSYFTPIIGNVAPILGAIFILTMGFGIIFFIAIGLYALVILLLLFVREPSETEIVPVIPTVK